MYRTAEKAEAERKEDHERLQKVRSRLEVLQSDRKRWKEQEEKLLENLEEQRAIWAEQDQQKTGAKLKAGLRWEGAAEGSGKCRNGEKQINEFTGSEIAEKLADAERELWIRSVWEQHWLKQKRKELTEQKQCILAEQEELKKIRQEIQEETQKTEQREQEIRKKSCGKRNKRLKEKHCWKRSGKRGAACGKRRNRTSGTYCSLGSTERTAGRSTETAKEELMPYRKTDGSTGGAYGDSGVRNSGFTGTAAPVRNRITGRFKGTFRTETGSGSAL